MSVSCKYQRNKNWNSPLYIPGNELQSTSGLCLASYVTENTIQTTEFVVKISAFTASGALNNAPHSPRQIEKNFNWAINGKSEEFSCFFTATNESHIN